MPKVGSVLSGQMVRLQMQVAEHGRGELKDSEDLSRGLPTYNELTISIRQQIDILGQPFLKWSAASAESEAAELQLQHQELVLVQQLKSRYADLLFFQQKLKTIEATAQAVQLAYNAAKARKEEGSLSGFELQRFSVELAKYQKELSLVVGEHRYFKQR